MKRKNNYPLLHRKTLRAYSLCAFLVTLPLLKFASTTNSGTAPFVIIWVAGGMLAFAATIMRGLFARRFGYLMSFLGVGWPYSKYDEADIKKYNLKTGSSIYSRPQKGVLRYVGIVLLYVTILFIVCLLITGIALAVAQLLGIDGT